MTYGRSGSTLLQGVLNSIPGYLIRGENGGALNQMGLIARTSKRVSVQFKSIAVEPTDSWYGISDVDPVIITAKLRDLFVRQYLRPTRHDRCIGFKEIRYGPGEVRDLAEHLAWMEEVFSPACFIFNERRIADTIQSGWWKDRPDAETFLEGFLERMRVAYGEGRSNYFWIRYDDYVGHPESLRPLFEFLDEPFDIERVSKVLAMKHSA